MMFVRSRSTANVASPRTNAIARWTRQRLRDGAAGVVSMGVPSTRRPVAYLVVASDAVQVAGVNLLHEGFVAPAAVEVDDLAVVRPDPDGLGEILEREALRMPEPVLGLRRVLADEALRDVAVVAGGEAVVARLLPAVVVVAHDVA